MSANSHESALRSLPAVGKLSEHPELSDHRTQHGQPVCRCSQVIATRETSHRDAPSFETFSKPFRATNTAPKPQKSSTRLAFASHQSRPLSDFRGRECYVRGSRLPRPRIRPGQRQRGSDEGVSAPLAELPGAEAGMVVNNCAAALLLMVTGLAGKSSTAISAGKNWRRVSPAQMMEARAVNSWRLAPQPNTPLRLRRSHRKRRGIFALFAPFQFKVEGF